MPSQASPRPVQPLRVLAVDTDASFLNAVKRVVESGRCRVDCASTAAEAVALLHRHQYDLVIADLEMPELGARELFARAAKQVEDGTRLLFLAAEPPAADLRHFLEEQRFACLPKPLHLRRFLDKLDDMLLLAVQPPDED